jgi:hypothetical protein
MSLSDDYRRLVRLRQKRARLNKRISALGRKLAGRKYAWGGRSGKHNRKG